MERTFDEKSNSADQHVQNCTNLHDLLSTSTINWNSLGKNPGTTNVPLFSRLQEPYEQFEDPTEHGSNQFVHCNHREKDKK